jgi:hypothetical protein
MEEYVEYVTKELHFNIYSGNTSVSSYDIKIIYVHIYCSTANSRHHA